MLTFVLIMLLSSAKCSDCVNENDYHLPIISPKHVTLLQCVNTLPYGRQASVNSLTSLALTVNLLTLTYSGYVQLDCCVFATTVGMLCALRARFNYRPATWGRDIPCDSLKLCHSRPLSAPRLHFLPLPATTLQGHPYPCLNHLRIGHIHSVKFIDKIL